MLVGIQALRGLAAYMVVLFHLSPFATMLGDRKTILDFGNGGVDLFFIISGLVMAVSAVRHKPKPLDFVANRITRIVPLYWLITTIVFVIALITPSLLQGTRADYLSLVKSLLFIPCAREDGSLTPIVYVGWTLNYEMFFYAIFAIGLAFHRLLYGMLFVFGTLSALVLIGLLFKPTSIASFYTNSIILEFGLGVCLGLALPSIFRLKVAPWLIIGLLCISLSAFVWTYIVWPGGERLFNWGVPAFLVVFCVLAAERRDQSKNRVMRAFGDASYSIYLTHFFVTQMAIKLAVTFHLQSFAAIGSAFILALVGVGAVGIVTHYTLERWMIRGARSTFGLLPAASLMTAMDAKARKNNLEASKRKPAPAWGARSGAG
jgi:exopolysaccharide production protein ExoZ